MSRTPSPRPYRRRSREFWIDTIDQWAISGLAQRQFCHDNDLALATFGLWRRRLAGEQDDPSAPRPVDTTPAEAGFVAVEVTDGDHHHEQAGDAIEILLLSGVRLQVPPQCSGRSLAEVLWALQATGQC